VSRLVARGALWAHDERNADQKSSSRANGRQRGCAASSPRRRIGFHYLKKANAGYRSPPRPSVFSFGDGGIGSLAWAGEETAGAADVGVARLFAVAISALVIDRDRLAARLVCVVAFRRGRLVGRRRNQRRAKKYDKRLSHLRSSLPPMQREVWSTGRAHQPKRNHFFMSRGGARITDHATLSLSLGA
jgi:hypothetical protein